MASLSGKKTRPLPHIVERKSSPAHDVNSDSGTGGRRHVSSSVPRTVYTPRAEKAAMKKLKQKMTFSDQSATSSTKSTPSKINRKPDAVLYATDPRHPKAVESMRASMTDPSNHRHKSHRPFDPQLAPSFVPVSYMYEPAEKITDTSDYASEGEITNSLTVSSLLSKLDSVKNFLKEAESMRSKFGEKQNEPGMHTQLNKLDKLIDQLQQQESGFLGELLRLMEVDDSKCDESEEEAFSEEEEEEEGGAEEFSSDEDNPTNQTVLNAFGKSERDDASASGEEGSLSLRAQMELEQQAEQELLALRQQKEMLTQLLEKQNQIQELEAKQSALYEMKTKAEQQLKEAEAKGMELQKLADTEVQVAKLEPNERDVLMSKLSELRLRKEKIDQMTQLLHTMRNSDDMGDDNEEEEEEGEEGLPSPPNTPDTKNQEDIRVSESAQITEGESELVSGNQDTVPELEALQLKLREASQTRERLKKLIASQKIMALQTRLDDDDGEHKDVSLSWRTKISPPRSQKKIKAATDDEVGSDAPDNELEKSLVSDYKEKLSMKKEEVSELLREREELRATHKSLLALQKKMHFRHFLDDSLPQNPDHEVHSQTDVTAATWGGSTVQSDPEDTATSVSIPSDIALNITQDTQDTNPPTEPGDGATIEESGRGKTPPFSVTRHTPRVRPNVRLRTQSLDSTEATQRADKKIKVDSRKPKKNKFGTLNNPLAASFKPSLKIKSPPKISKNTNSSDGPFSGGGASFEAGNLNVGEASPSMGGAIKWGGAPSLFSEREHTVTLQNQLALTSNMCNQLLYGQNNLIRAVCERRDHPAELHPQVQERMVMLQNYQLELEAYYHQLCESFTQLHQQKEEGKDDEASGGCVPESEEPVASYAGRVPDTINEEGPSQLHSGMEPAVGDQSDPTALYTSQYLNPYPSYGGPQYSGYLPPPPPLLNNPQQGPNNWFTPSLAESAAVGYPQALYESPRYDVPLPPGMGMRPSPFRLPNERPSFLQSMPAPGNSSFNVSQYTSQDGRAGPYYGYQYPPPPPPPPMGIQGPLNLNTSLNLQASHGGGGLVSPSGVTASSLQVHAPSSTHTNSSNGVQQDAGKGNHQEAPSHTTRASALTSAGGDDNVEGSAQVVLSDKDTNVLSGEMKREAESNGNSMSSDILGENLDTSLLGGDDPSAGFSVFDALRDTIYSEVATLIANNENRPHFLVELFRELQMLSTDYLRQRALYSLQDLVTRFLTEEAVAGEAKAAINQQYLAWLGDASDNSGQSGSENGSSKVRSKPVLLNRSSQAFDYAEAVNSASSISTPPHEPFASDDLGETVVKLDKAVARMRQLQKQSERKDNLVMSPLSPLNVDDSETQSDSMQYPDFDTQLLDEQIKTIMIDVIPILKDNIDKKCDQEMMLLIRERILSLVHEQEKDQKQDYLGAFRKQLDLTISTTMEKYRDKKYRECGEDLLMDISEVLFNELAFFKLMQDFRGHPQLSSDFRSVTSSQTTTEPEDNSSYVEGEGEDDDGGRHKMLDPALLHILSVSANVNLQEEEDILGKSRDDALATCWGINDRSHDSSSISGSEDVTPVNVVELSVSESQPIQSVGSGDEEIARKTASLTITEEPQSLSSGMNDSVTTEAVGGGHPDPEDGGNTTPPTPLADDPAAATAGDPEDGGNTTPPTPFADDPAAAAVAVPAAGDFSSEAHPKPLDEVAIPTIPEDKDDATIEKVSTIAREGEDGMESALSPPASVSNNEVVPQISTLTEGELETRVKSEQRNTEGVGGILASLKEQGSELGLVGDENANSI